MKPKKTQASPEDVLAEVGAHARRIRALDDEIADVLETLKRLRGERANLLKQIIDETADPNQARLPFDEPASPSSNGKPEKGSSPKKAAAKKSAKKKSAKKASAKKSASRVKKGPKSPTPASK